MGKEICVLRSDGTYSTHSLSRKPTSSRHYPKSSSRGTVHDSKCPCDRCHAYGLISSAEPMTAQRLAESTPPKNYASTASTSTSYSIIPSATYKLIRYGIPKYNASTGWSHYADCPIPTCPGTSVRTCGAWEKSFYTCNMPNCIGKYAPREIVGGALGYQ